MKRLRHPIFSIIGSFASFMWWAVLGLSFLVRLLPEGYHLIANAMVNVLMFLLFYRVMVLWHELGHLAFGKWLGGVPRIMFLGVGTEVRRFVFGEFWVMLLSKVNSGWVICTFEGVRLNRFTHSLYILGGSLFNFGLAILIYLLFGFQNKFFESLNVTTALILANVYLGIWALIPRILIMQGRETETDGLAFWRIIRGKKSHARSIEDYNQLNKDFQASNALAQRDYHRAYNEYLKLTAEFPQELTYQVNLAMIKSKLGYHDEAFEMIESLHSRIEEQETQYLMAIILNMKAWLLLIKDQPEEGLAFVKKAIEIDKTQTAFYGTLGCLLVAKGQLHDGVAWLLGLVDLNVATSESLMAAIYLALGYHKQGKSQKAKKYLDFAREHYPQMDLDDQLLFDRAREELNTMNPDS